MTGSLDSGGAFELAPAQRMLAETVYELSRRHVAPRAAEIDENDEYPEDIFQLLKAHDLLGLYVPEAYGGAGLGVLETCVAIEQIARFCSNSPLFFSVHLLATRPVAIGGSETQKKTYLTGVARGELRPAFAHTEPHAGSDAANKSTRSERDGDS
ncbi:MAG: acyl-CoA dehydrogenase family protein, partial [Nitrospinae bacterium]|nr:acyl-CoA dehydrogenase family protein [Nitrospinota bacterium]